LDIQSLGVNQEKGEEAKLIKPRRRWVVVFPWNPSTRKHIHKKWSNTPGTKFCGV